MAVTLAVCFKLVTGPRWRVELTYVGDDRCRKSDHIDDVVNVVVSGGSR